MVCMPQHYLKQRNQVIVVAICLVAAALYALSSLTAAYPVGWTAKPLTSLPKELHEAPSITVYEKNIHVVWNTWHNEFDSKVYYTHSLDNGRTWSEPFCLTPNSTTAIYPVVAVNDSIVHVVWKDYRNGNPEIYYRRSMDNGESWSGVQRITYNSSRKNNIYDIGLAVDNSNVYLVWKDYRSGSSEIFFKKSVDNGENWGSDQRLTYDYTPSYGPCMTINGENIYISWEEWGHRSDICFMRSNDGGENWTGKVYLTNVTEGDSEHPSLAAWENNVYLVWQDTRTGRNQVYFRRSGDYGGSWSETRQITDDTTVRFNPKIGVHEDRLTVVGQGKENGRFIIWCITSMDGGESWSDPIQLTEGDVDAYDVDMALQSHNLYIVWQKYHEAGWADIWFMSNCSEEPVVTSISLSNTSISSPATVEIVVDGFDPTYDKTELTCIIEYKPPSGTWTTLYSTFTDDHWRTYLALSNDSSSGTYLIRAKLVNPAGAESDWSNTQTLEVSFTGRDSNVSGFTVCLFVFAFLIVTILFWVKSHER